MLKIKYSKGWNENNELKKKFSEPFSKLVLENKHTYKSLYLKIKNINKKNVIKIFKDNLYHKTLELSESETSVFKIDCEENKTIDIISENFEKQNSVKKSFELEKIFLDEIRVNLFDIDSFKNKLQTKKIINAYSLNFNGGIGDFIRGSIFLYRYCKYNEFEFNIDFKHHPFKEYLKNKNESDVSYPEESIYDISKNCSFNPACVSKYFSKILSEKDERYIISSYYIDFLHPNVFNLKQMINVINNFKLNKDEKEFFKKTFIFSDVIEKRYNKWLIKNKIKEKKYAIIHARTGDSNFIKEISGEKMVKEYCTNSNIDIEDLYQKIKLFQAEVNLPVVVLSDSNSLKSVIKKKKDPKIIVSETESSHSVLKPGVFEFTEIILNNLKFEDIMFDMKILSQSYMTKIFSVYFWGSGFSSWTSKIFDVPCEAVYIETDPYEEKKTKSEVTPYGYGPWNYQLELNYNDKDSILNYLNKLINTFFIAENYKIYIHGTFPNILNFKNNSYIKELKTNKIKDSELFSNLKNYCEECKIEKNKTFFMNEIINYGKHFCENIGIRTKINVFTKHIKKHIHIEKTFDPDNQISIVVDSMKLGENEIKYIQNFITNTKYKKIDILLNKIYNKKTLKISNLNKDLKLSIYYINDKLDRIFYSKNVMTFEEDVLETLSVINENIKTIYFPITLKEYVEKNIDNRKYNINILHE
jgi:hypothetical protein